MIDIEAAVRALLVADPAVLALVAGRIYPDVLPQAPTLPAVVYQEISNVPVMSHDGPGLQQARIQLDVYATSRLLALQVEAAIFATLCPRHDDGQAVGYRRVAAGVEVQGVIPSTRRSGFEDDTRLYRRGRDFMVTAASAA